MNEMSVAVHHMHISGVAHCDIKPTNIVFDSDFTPFIIDFDIGRFDARESGVFSGVLATHTYRPPEFYSLPTTVTPASTDYFSLGVVFLELIIGFNFYSKYTVGKFKPHVRNLPKSLYMYLSTLLHSDPHKRCVFKLPIKNDEYYKKKIISEKFRQYAWTGSTGTHVKLLVAA